MSGGVNRGYPAKMMLRGAERSRQDDPVGGGNSGGVEPRSDGTWRKEPWWAGGLKPATPLCQSRYRSLFCLVELIYGNIPMMSRR